MLSPCQHCTGLQTVAQACTPTLSTLQASLSPCAKSCPGLSVSLGCSFACGRCCLMCTCAYVLLMTGSLTLVEYILNLESYTEILAVTCLEKDSVLSEKGVSQVHLYQYNTYISQYQYCPRGTGNRSIHLKSWNVSTIR